MANDLNIRIKINSDTKALEVTQDGFEKISQKSADASDSVGVFAGSLGKVAALAATGLGFAGLTASASSFIETSGKFEQYAVSLKVLSGSAQKAEQSLAWVKDFTAKTPYTLDQTMEAFIRLKAYGIDATDGSLKTLGDTAAALGKPLMASVEAMADAMTGENERLKEFGITAKMSGNTIAYNWIDSSGQAKTQIIENNKQIIKSTLEAIFNEKYAGMMDEQAKTWVGAVSNLEDSWTSLKDTIARDSGMFDSAKKIVNSLNLVISNQNGELEELIHYTKEAAIAAGTFYSITLLGTGIAALKEINIATKIATISQLTFNTAVKLNPWIATAALIGTASAALYEYKGLLNSIEANHAKLAGQTAFTGDLKFLQGKDTNQQLHDTVKRSKELRAEQEVLIQTYKLRNGYAYQSSKNDKEQADRKARILAITEEQNALVAYAEKLKQIKAASALKGANNDKTAVQIALPEKGGIPKSDKPKKGKTPAQTEAEELNVVIKRLDLQQSATLDYYKTIGDASSVYAIEEADKLQKLASAGILTNEQILAVWDADNKKFTDKKTADEQEYLNKLSESGNIFAKENEEKNQKKLDSEKYLYSSMLQLSGDWYTSESIKLGEQYNEFEKAGIDKLQLQEWLNASMFSLDKKHYDEQSELAKKQFEEQNKFWLDLFGDVEKAMDNQIFDAMVGKWNSFGDWLSDFWSSLTTSIARAASSQLSSALIGGVKDLLLGTPNTANMSLFRSVGSAFTADAILADNGYVSATALSSIQSLSGSTVDAAGFTTTAGGSVLDAAGQVTKSGSDIGTLLNAASGLQSAYAAMTTGLGTMAASGSASLATGAYNLGWTAAGDFFTGGATGLLGTGSGFATGSAGSYGATLIPMVGGALMGGLAGYATGAIGDRIFGADTRAANYGAIGGAIGTVILPGVGTAIGAALGSIIGGAFGSTKVQKSGYAFTQTTSADAGLEDVKTFQEMRKKSWFKSSEWTDYYALSGTQKKAVEGVFDTYDYLLTQLGSSEKIFIDAGNYVGDSYKDVLSKNFISLYTGIEQTISGVFGVEIKNAKFDDIYSYWSDYATSIDKTVTEALTTSIGSYITATRQFSEWQLGSGTVEQLKFKSDYLNADLSALEAQMGVSDISVENFLSEYEKAIKDSFDPQTIAQWQNLGTALMSATDAYDAYINAVDATTESLNNAASAAAASALSLQKTAQDMLLTGESNFNTSQKAAYAKNLLTENAAAFAVTGSDAAKANMEQYAKEYLTNLKSSTTDADEYRKSVAQVMQLLGGATPYATGGIVNSPTWSIVGERGPEAVIPLSSGAVPVNIQMQGSNDNADTKMAIIKGLTLIKKLVDTLDRVTQGGNEIRVRAYP
ncbi:MAG: tape measure protein [Sulfuricurvum sp.]|jgi:hypothetical protein|uniref:tape measure protein n=1 Tax=Sulfuricurvum sp. TaxID=2025608 RepID=UPI0025DE4C41|nr:tape measure protein [Sulfuricurvum sp.]MCK9372575.1 tape measure protein [Sulfuricurvum sp.]